MLRQQAAAQELALSDLAARQALLSRARVAARGNPGLQDLLIARLVLNPAVPLAEAEAALAQMERYLAGGELPQSEQLRELLENIAVQALLGLAGSAGRLLLQAMRLFELPVPIGVAERLAVEIGGDVQSLIDLALLEPGADPVQPGQSAVRISPLVACRVPLPEASDQSPLAAIAAGALFAAWGGEAGGRPAVADLQLARLALVAEDAPIAAACGAGAIRALEPSSYTSAAQLSGDLVSLLRRAAHPAPWALLANAARMIGGAGDGESADALLAEGVAALEAAQEAADGDGLLLLDEYASRLYRRGQLDEALRIRTEEELPVYGAPRGRALQGRHPGPDRRHPASARPAR